MTQALTATCEDWLVTIVTKAHAHAAVSVMLGLRLLHEAEMGSIQDGLSCTCSSEGRQKATKLVRGGRYWAFSSLVRRSTKLSTRLASSL